VTLLDVYNSLPHHASVGGVFFQLFILHYPGNCVSLHPDNTKKKMFIRNHLISLSGCHYRINADSKRKKIIMIREPIIIDNPSPKALEVIERMKEDKRRDVHSRKHISLARLERESMTVNESEQKLTDVIHRQYNRL
jgi:hypothetical protein